MSKDGSLNQSSIQTGQLEMEDMEDKLFNGYLCRNMAKIASKVKVREIVPHLPCLTQSDRETIELKRENSGNYNAMQLLMACLRSKDTWLEEFLSSLRMCEHSTLASQIQEQYESLKVQPNGTALAPRPSVSDGTPQPPLDPSPAASPGVAETSALVVPLPAETNSDDGTSTNHTDSPPAVVPSQSPPEHPAASLQTSLTQEDTGASPLSLPVAPTVNTPSPAVPFLGPQVPLLKIPDQDTNPADTKLYNTADKASESSLSAEGQVMAKDKHANPVVAILTQDTAAVMASLTVQDATDCPASPSCVRGTSPGEEGCLRKPVTLMCIHSVQVHQPFDSPSTFPPIPEESLYPVNLKCSSNSNHSTECIIPSSAERITSGDTESVDLCDLERVTTYGTASVALGDAERVVPSDAEYITPGNKERAASGYAESVDPDDADVLPSGDTRRVSTENVVGFLPDYKKTIVQSNKDSIVSGDTGSVAPSIGESVVPDSKARVAAIDTKSLLRDDTESVAPGELGSIILGNPESRAVKNDICPHSPTTSNHIPESVIHDDVGPGSTHITAADIMESIALCNGQSTASSDIDSKVPSDTHLFQNVSKEKNSVPASNYSSQRFYPGEADCGVPGEGDSRTPGQGDVTDSGAPGKGDSGAPGGRDSGGPGEGDSGAPAEKDCRVSGEGDSGAPGQGDNGGPSEEFSGAPAERDSGAPGGRDSGGPGEGDSGAPAEEDCRVSGEGDSGAPGQGDNGGPSEEFRGAPAERDSGGPGDTDSWGPGQGDIGAPGEKDHGASEEGASGVPDEVCIIVQDQMEQPQSESEGHWGNAIHVEVSLASASMFNQTPKNTYSGAVKSTTPNEVRSIAPSHPKSVVSIGKDQTHKEWLDNQCNSTHRQISLSSSALSDYSPATAAPNRMESVTPGNAETLYIEPENNHYSSVNLNISLSSAGSCIQSTDSINPNNIGSVPPDEINSPNSMGSTPPEDTNIPNKQLTEDHCNSTHQSISLTNADSVNHKPESVEPVDMESHTHKLMESHYNSACRGVTDEQAEPKNDLCVSEDSVVQYHLAFDETPGGGVTKNHHLAEALPEQTQPNTSNLPRNYYVHAAAAAVVGAVMLWQLKK